jgi:hypothetical protein
MTEQAPAPPYVLHIVNTQDALSACLHVLSGNSDPAKMINVILLFEEAALMPNRALSQQIESHVSDCGADSDKSLCYLRLMPPTAHVPSAAETSVSQPNTEQIQTIMWSEFVTLSIRAKQCITW